MKADKDYDKQQVHRIVPRSTCSQLLWLNTGNGGPHASPTDGVDTRTSAVDIEVSQCQSARGHDRSALKTFHVAYVDAVRVSMSLEA